jgi:chemotaxis protein CheY-P-specific phosphatase CheC/ActR/RegA family two-component response regulator
MKKAKERLDKIMGACRERMQEEVSALLGKTLTFADPQTKVLTKEDFFSEPAGKSVLAHVKLDGDIEGHGCLIAPIRDAIRIGGTLIMLPDSELETVISEEEYTEELEDSYGEIANIICGSLSTTFEEQFPKTFRLVRTEQEVILPVKVAIDSDEPVPDGSYYLMTSAMALEGVEMGNLQLLLPAASFGLVEEPADAEADEPVPAAEDTGVVDEATSEQPVVEQPDVIEREAAAPVDQAEAVERPEQDAGEAAATPTAGKMSDQDVEKQKERIDQLLANCLEKIGEEVGALLGGTLKIQPEENGVFSKEGLLEQAGGKQVLARMEVRGEGQGESYLFVSLKDAIFLGGTLIMLPDAELEEVVRNEEFGEDAEDAYGEIANIIAGVYTAVFEEQYRKSLGFVKTGLETVIPVKIDPDSDDVLPKDLYYVSSGAISYNDNALGRLQMVFPAALLELAALAGEEVSEEPEPAAQAVAQKADGTAAGDTAPQSIRSGSPEQGAVKNGNAGVSAADSSEAANILLFTDDDTEAGSIADLLAGQGYTPRILHYRDAAADYLSSAVTLVFLIMQEVNEQGFGMAIKLSSSGLKVPLIVGGPAWTRTTVLKAVKYGAADILMTPATVEDICEKLEANLVKKAA